MQIKNKIKMYLNILNDESIILDSIKLWIHCYQKLSSYININNSIDIEIISIKPV